MARAIEDGDMSDAEQRLQAARQALEQALKDGASDEEIKRLTDELRQAMQEFLESYMAEMQQRGLQNLPQMPGDQQMQMLPSRICRRCSIASKSWRSSAIAMRRRNC